MRSRSKAGAGTGRSAPRRWPRDHRTLPPARCGRCCLTRNDVDRRLTERKARALMDWHSAQCLQQRCRLMGVRDNDGPTGSATGQTTLAHRPAVLQARRVPAGARQPHPDPPGDQGGGRRRDCLGGRPAGRSAQPALLRAAGRDPDRPAHRLRLALAGLPAGRRGGAGGGRSLGGQPLPDPERLEHRHHREAQGLFEATATARRDHEGHQLTARWNARARRQHLVLERADEALRVGDRITIQTRSITRALVDGAPAARPMPAVGAMLVSAASAVEAYAAWVASPGEPADRQRLSDAIRAAGQTSGQAVARAQRRWRDDPAQWLTFGTILAMSQRILAEVSSPLESPDEAP